MFPSKGGFLSLLLVSWFLVSPANAHTASRGFVLLLPTNLIIACGATAVLASFLGVFLLRNQKFRHFAKAENQISQDHFFISLLQAASALALVALVIVGLLGSTDPLENPLPLFIWTFWWVIMVVLQSIFAGAWAWLNPIPPILRAALWLGQAPRDLPGWLAGLSTVMVFAVFVWWQLIWTTPEDPRQLAWLLIFYGAVTFLGCFLFGKTWLEKADPFQQIFAWLAGTAPIRWRNGLELRWPGGGLAAMPALSWWQLTLLVMLLATLSFDGLANTFFWFQLIGENPLEFHGRGTVLGRNTVGLIAVTLILGGLNLLVVALGWSWSEKRLSFRNVLQAQTLSLVPISIALHFSHFLPEVMVNGQYLLKWAGVGPEHVTESLLNSYSGARFVYGAQAISVVFGHMTAVLVVRWALSKCAGNQKNAFLLELPLALWTVAYTAFSLWVLSSATIG